jgi:hypothetical protein
LPRFGGHLILLAGGINDAHDACASSTRVPPADPGAGPRARRTPREPAPEFEVSAQAIPNWVRQADRDEGRRSDGLTTEERHEFLWLRRENRQVRKDCQAIPVVRDEAACSPTILSLGSSWCAPQCPQPAPPAEGLLEVAQSVAATLDVQHGAELEQLFDDGGGQDLLAGKELGPVLDPPCWW